MLPGSDLSCSQYLFVMLHLQSLQFTSFRTFSLTLVLCLMKLNNKHTITKTNPTLESTSVIFAIQCKKQKLKHNHATYTGEYAVNTAYLIGQISNLTLESLNLPPQILFFLIHSLPVTPLFSEVLFKDLYLKYKTIKKQLREYLYNCMYRIQNACM